MKLCVNNLSLRATKKTLVDNVSFELDHGQSLAIIGPSGSGKSSLLKGILGINDNEVQQSGKVIFSSEKVRFGYIPQELSLWPHLSVIETLKLAYHFSQNQQNEAALNIFDLIRDCGLTNQQAQKPHSLSGGEKQRLALSRALVNAPHVLVLDEPFAHLDIVAKTGLIELIIEIKKRMRLSIIFVSHDLAEALTLGEQIMIMDGGTLVWLGKKSELNTERFRTDWNPFSSPLLKIRTL